MADPTPEEDAISRRMLWERLELAKDRFEEYRKSMNDDMGAVLVNFRKELSDMLEKAKASAEPLIQSNREESEKLAKDITLSNIELTAQYQKMLMDFIRGMEEKLQRMREDIPRLVHENAGAMLQDSNLRIAEIEKLVDKFTSGFNQSLNNYQMANQDRFNIVNNKLDRVLETLRSFLKEL